MITQLPTKLGLLLAVGHISSVTGSILRSKHVNAEPYKHRITGWKEPLMVSLPAVLVVVS